jgi:multiple sugar transport system permease protein
VRVSLILPLMMTPFLVYLNWTYLTAPAIGPLDYLVGVLTGNYIYPFFDAYPNVYFGFLMVDIWQWLPFVIVILLAGMRSLSKTPFEAASIDGATTWARFRYIMLPAIRPVLAIVVLFRFMDTLNSFGNVAAFTGGGPGEYTYFISWLIWRTGLGTGSAIGLASAYAIIYLIIALVIAWSLMYIIHRSGR